MHCGVPGARLRQAHWIHTWRTLGRPVQGFPAVVCRLPQCSEVPDYVWFAALLKSYTGCRAYCKRSFSFNAPCSSIYARLGAPVGSMLLQCQLHTLAVLESGMQHAVRCSPTQMLLTVTSRLENEPRFPETGLSVRHASATRHRHGLRISDGLTSLLLSAARSASPLRNSVGLFACSEQHAQPSAFDLATAPWAWLS